MEGEEASDTPGMRPLVTRLPPSHPWFVTSALLLLVGLLMETWLAWGVLFNTPGHTLLGAAAGLGLATIVIFWLCVLPFFAIRAIRLVVSPSGLAYQAWGYSVRTPWENVASVSRRRVDGAPREGFHLRQPALHTAWWMRAYLRAQPAVLLAGILRYPEMRGVVGPRPAFEGSFIPIPAWLGEDWRAGPLAQALRAFAPNLKIEPPHRPHPTKA